MKKILLLLLLFVASGLRAMGDIETFDVEEYNGCRTKVIDALADDSLESFRWVIEDIKGEKLKTSLPRMIIKHKGLTRFGGYTRSRSTPGVRVQMLRELIERYPEYLNKKFKIWNGEKITLFELAHEKNERELAEVLLDNDYIIFSPDDGPVGIELYLMVREPFRGTASNAEMINKLRERYRLKGVLEVAEKYTKDLLSKEDREALDEYNESLRKHNEDMLNNPHEKHPLCTYCSERKPIQLLSNLYARAGRCYENK